MALTDFWEIKDNQVFGGKAILNVYHAKRILAGANAGNVGQAFLDSIVSVDLRSLQPNNLTRTTVEVANLGDATDFASIGSTGFPGQAAPDKLPSFNAATIQFNRTRNDMKNGQKRFLVGNETEQLDGSWIAAFIASLNTLATTIVTPWETAASPGVDVCEFAVLKRFCVVGGQDPCLAYRLPNTNTEVDDNHFIPFSIISRTRVRSQVSRKVLQ